MFVLIRLLNFLVAVALAAGFIWHSCDAAGFAACWGRCLPHVERFLFPAAVVLVALNLYGILMGLIRRLKRRRDIEITSGDGNSIVSIAAVEKRLLDLATKFPDIRQARVALRIKKKDAPIQCAMTFGLAREHDVTGRVEEIKRCLHNAFQKLLPGAPGIEINARVVELRDEEARNPLVDDTFTGPVYPVHEQGAAGEEDEH